MIFYDLMWYNYPKNKQYFKVNPDLLENIKYDVVLNKELSSDTSSLEKIIDKYHYLYNKIPFIEHIYVSNSLSFKSVHEKSDIDFFIICKDNRIFLWKLFVRFFFKIFWIYWNHSAWKFCTWFYITSMSKDLYPISIYPLDLYLAYWIAHLQHLYSHDQKRKDDIYKENMRVRQIIPGYEMKEERILKFKQSYWDSFLKRSLEFIFWWNFLENFIGFFWKKKMKSWRKRYWKDWRTMIISDNILKFHAPDIRKIVYLKYKTLKQEPFYKVKDNRDLF